MAIVRCTQCLLKSAGFTIHAEPIGYPETALICGMAGCERPGLVWLRGREAVEYIQGGRVSFPLNSGNRPAKVRVKAP
jgi:hypothetical protein